MTTGAGVDSGARRNPKNPAPAANAATRKPDVDDGQTIIDLSMEWKLNCGPFDTRPTVWMLSPLNHFTAPQLPPCDCSVMMPPTHGFEQYRRRLPLLQTSPDDLPLRVELVQCVQADSTDQIFAKWMACPARVRTPWLLHDLVSIAFQENHHSVGQVLVGMVRRMDRELRAVKARPMVHNDSFLLAGLYGDKALMGAYLKTMESSTVRDLLHAHVDGQFSSGLAQYCSGSPTVDSVQVLAMAVRAAQAEDQSSKGRKKSQSRTSVQELLDGNPRSQAFDGNHALDVALQCGRADMVRFLLKVGARWPEDGERWSRGQYPPLPEMEPFCLLTKAVAVHWVTMDQSGLQNVMPRGDEQCWRHEITDVSLMRSFWGDIWWPRHSGPALATGTTAAPEDSEGSGQAPPMWARLNGSMHPTLVQWWALRPFANEEQKRQAAAWTGPEPVPLVQAVREAADLARSVIGAGNEGGDNTLVDEAGGGGAPPAVTRSATLDSEVSTGAGQGVPSDASSWLMHPSARPVGWAREAGLLGAFLVAADHDGPTGIAMHMLDGLSASFEDHEPSAWSTRLLRFVGSVINTVGLDRLLVYTGVRMSTT